MEGWFQGKMARQRGRQSRTFHGMDNRNQSQEKFGREI